jgi:hypothetical protein
MDEPRETPPQAAHEPAVGHATRNGSVPIGDELRLALRAIEDIDMRLQGIQLACALLVGLMLLNLALEVKELRR